MPTATALRAPTPLNNDGDSASTQQCRALTISGLPVGLSSWRRALNTRGVAVIDAHGVKAFECVANLRALLQALMKTGVFAINLGEMEISQEHSDALIEHVAAGGPIRRYYIERTREWRRQSGLIEALRSARKADRADPSRAGAAWLWADQEAWQKVSEHRVEMGDPASSTTAAAFHLANL